VRELATILLVDVKGMEGNPTSLCEVPILISVTSSCMAGPNRKSADQNQNTSQLRTINPI
jgi:hypothetical protein